MLLSSDVVEAIDEALFDNDEEFARQLLRDNEATLSCRQKTQVRDLFKQHKDKQS